MLLSPLLCASLLAVAPPADGANPPAPDAADVVTITGTARTADGQPAAGVRVTVVGWKPLDAPPSVSGVTDADGRYVLRDLPHPHTHVVLLIARGPDGAVGSGLANLWPEDATTFDSKLSVVPGGRLSLRLTGADGAPVAGAKPVSVTGDPGSGERLILTDKLVAAAGEPWPASDADGRLTLDHLPAGAEVRVVFDPPGQHRQITELLTVPAADAAPDPIAVTVREAGRFEVTIVPGEGAAPLPRDGYQVEVRGHGQLAFDTGTYEERSLDAAADGSGVIAVKVPASGPEVEAKMQYFRPGATNESLETEDSGAGVTVTHPDLVFAPSSVTTVLDPGERDRARLTALRRATVTGRLVDPATGEPRGGRADYCTVQAYIPATDGRRWVGAAGSGWMGVGTDRSRATAEEDGRFAVDVPVGRVRLVAEGGSRTSLIPLLLERDVPPGGLDLGDVPLASAPELTGTVTTPDGAPVPGAVVWITDASLLSAPPTVADADGRFALQPQPPRFMREQAVPPGEAVAVELAAFAPKQPLEGTAEILIVPGAAPEPTTLRLEPKAVEPPPDAPGDRVRFTFTGRFSQGDPVPELPAAEAFAPDGTPTEDPVTLESLRGRWVLLNFTSLLHHRRDAAEAEVRAVAEAYDDRLTVVTVYHASDSAEEITEALAKRPAAGPKLRDGDGAVQRAYGVVGVPAQILIDPRGRFQRAFAPEGQGVGELPRVVRRFVLAP